MPQQPITEFAPAKVNLTLHVTGQRADGYHLLDSLVVFCGIGDVVTATTAAQLGLRVTGPQAHLLSSGQDNLVTRAAKVMDAHLGAALVLDKHLPLASGIGGGSADAAATLRALARLWGVPLPNAAAVLSLGADVPVCLAGRPARMRGVGERLDFIKPLPALHMTLVNPRVAVATPAVFKALVTRANPPMPDILPDWPDAKSLANWLKTQRNDLELPAIALAPIINEVLADLAAQPGAMIARMSGSGATCFSLFETAVAAQAAAGAIGAAHPNWWAESGPVYPGPDADQLIRSTT